MKREPLTNRDLFWAQGKLKDIAIALENNEILRIDLEPELTRLFNSCDNAFCRKVENEHDEPKKRKIPKSCECCKYLGQCGAEYATIACLIMLKFRESALADIAVKEKLEREKK